MRIHAFHGIRYSAGASAGHLAGPPYDQIDDDLQRRLHRQPHHFAHLIRPADPEGNHHQRAAALHRQWLAAGVLARDTAPALYIYEIVLAGGGRRLGLATLLGLEDPGSGIIRPHEATVAKTVDERLSLLHTTAIDFEPILVLADDGGDLDRLLAEDLKARRSLVEHRDADDNLHRLYRIADPERIEVYRRSSAATVGLIADGHHRYTVARRYAAQTGATAGSGAATKLAVITSLTAAGLAIDPIHRRLEQALPIDAARQLAIRHQSLSPASGGAIADAIRSARQPALGVSFDGRTEIWSFDQDDPAAGPPAHLRHLPVGWLHEVVLPTLGLDAAAATDGTVTYRSDPERLFSELQEGSAAMGFWLAPMSGDDFARALAGGSLLPPKSTRFLPKVASGLVWAAHQDPIG